MKGLKKIALASAIAAISAGAQAELKALDDSTMGEMTGQAGINIDVKTKWQLGEFMYSDADAGARGGSVVVQNITLGGSTSTTETAWNAANPGAASGGYLDNYRLYLDVAGGGGTNGNNSLEFGLSTTTSLSTVIVYANIVGAPTPANAAAAAAGMADQETVAASAFFNSVAPGIENRGAPIDMDRQHHITGDSLFIDRKRTYGDGDLVIKSTFTDPWQKGGGFSDYVAGTGASQFGATDDSTSVTELFYSEANTIMSKSVDFNFSFEVLGLASSAYSAGDAASDLTGSASSGQQYATAYGVALGNTIHKSHNGYNGRSNNGIDPDTTTTTLISDLSINGYFGPSEFILRNRGNGFANVNTAGDYAYGDAISGIETSRYIAITDLDVFIDIAGVAIKDLSIHNTRGDLSGLNQVINPLTGLMENTSSYGFAHGSRDINAVKDNVLDLGRAIGAAFATPGAGGSLNGFLTAGHDLTQSPLRQVAYTDGIKMRNQFKGDIDIPHLSFGNDGRTIGAIYLTDYQSDTYLTISAHNNQ